MSLIDGELFRKKFFALDIEFRPSQIDAVFDCLGDSEIADLPSAERTGEWKRRIVDYGWNADWVCSECGHRVYYDFVNFNYCPNCGARMVAKMTVTETQMHHFICAWCDNPKCVRGTDKCEFEQWKKKKEGERKNECID